MTWRAIMTILLLVLPRPSFLGATEQAKSAYIIPTGISARPFRFDYRSVTGAILLADFELSQDGRPRNLAVRHGNTHFLGAAVRAVESWRFELAEEKVEHARIALVFLFRRPQLIGAGSRVQDVAQVEYPQDEVPPQPRRIIEPSHPIRVAWDGLAVVGLAVDERGVVAGVTRLFGPSEFLSTMENVVRRWEFEPARQAMERVAAGIVVAVYFPRPTLAQPRIRRPR